VVCNRVVASNDLNCGSRNIEPHPTIALQQLVSQRLHIKQSSRAFHAFCNFYFASSGARDVAVADPPFLMTVRRTTTGTSTEVIDNAPVSPCRREPYHRFLRLRNFALNEVVGMRTTEVEHVNHPVFDMINHGARLALNLAAGSG